MKENSNKAKPKKKLNINLNSHISKPSFLMTVNPDKFLQKPNRKSAMSIKDRDEINPEMAEIVRKILIKRKKEKKSYNKNNNSMIKSRKVDTIKKFFDDNYNKKHGFNKDNYYNLNKTLIFDSLHDRIGSDINQIHYFDYINRCNNGNKSARKNNININCNYSFSRNNKKSSQNYGNLKTSRNIMDNYGTVYRPAKYPNNRDNEFKYNKKLSNSLNLREIEGEEYSPKNIKIIKNNQYILNLNSITIDMDQINKDKNLMEMNCGILNGNVMSPNRLNIKKDNNNINNSQKKHIQIKRIKKKYSEENNEIPPKNAGKETFSTKNSLIYDIKLMDNSNSNSSNIKNKLLDINKKNNIINNFKSNNKSKEAIRKNRNKINLNHSLEYRNKYNINKQENENKFSMTMSNGFFGGKSYINHIRNINSNLNINKFKKKQRKKSLNSNYNMNINKINQKDFKKGVMASSYVKKDNKLKMIKESMNKRFNKSIINNRANININNINNMINKKQNNVQTNRYKYKPSPTHSKHENNLSTERGNINKRNKKVVINNFNNRNRNYAQNRSLSKDHFQTEPTQKLNLNFNKSYINNKVSMPGINDESLSMNLSNKTNVIKAQYIRNKKNENENEKDKNLENNKVPNGQVNTSNNKVLHSSSKKKEYPNMSSKKEYPNMAKYIYGKRPSSDNVDDEEVKSSKNRETKAIKKIESLCKKGYSGPGVKKTNQDNFFIYNNFNNNSNYVYLGVCDGHGLFGQDISGYLVNNLPQNMNNNVISKGIKNLSTEKITTLSEIFQETFVQTNSALNVDERIDSSFSGSTCVSLLFTPTRICCINVGDSRCIIGKFNGYEWKSKVLSRDHKPSEPDEMNRILKSGGRVEAYRDNFGNFVGPERVWNKQGDGPGLAMSRSFGDEIGHKVGVVVDPEIMEHYFLKEDKFIVLGSDGIWEFIGNDEVVEIVKDYYLENNIEGAIEHLYNEASKRWIMEEQVIDDITVIIIFLN